jgi:hypothetical protein
MANRKERRTMGIAMAKRLQILRNSSLYKQANLTDIPEDVIKTLVAGNCENKTLQAHYNKCHKVLDEVMDIEIRLHNMRTDLSEKIKLQKEKSTNLSPKEISH